ncbi:MAG: hypothetical protein A2287_07410 [Candidatus Melainabacteria bacterium RIFOXYA12_FULL_32_12]|nr:MAG: hypothetical protein A2255_00400 [Candidatus Melainabacteria bacterium RIFOXYA2_FULL_32_9]OGI29259.1 MAG: hypothetical protein A2287_07410 [Candidatus Melainabacteria bacterium RIFOXYA12_FULL_32_12]
MNILVLLAGNSTDFFNKGYLYPKYLTEIQGKPLVEYVINSYEKLKEANFIFTVLKEDSDRFHLNNVINLLIPNAKIVNVENVTKGAACTALLAVEHINNDEPLLIVNGDQILEVDFTQVINSFTQQDLAGGIITFDSVHPRWSYVRLGDDNLVIEAAEKRPISRHATAGVYYFKRGKDFVESAMDMIEKDASVNDLYYVCPSYNEMILKQHKIGTYNIDREQYISVAAPEDISSFLKHLENKKETCKR